MSTLLNQSDVESNYVDLTNFRDGTKILKEQEKYILENNRKVLQEEITDLFQYDKNNEKIKVLKKPEFIFDLNKENNIKSNIINNIINVNRDNIQVEKPFEKGVPILKIPNKNQIYNTLLS